jgi:hypothetical protein
MRTVRLALFALLALTLVAPLAAQAPVTVNDLARLDIAAADVAKLNEALKKSDPTMAAEVEKSLADAKDEIVYLRVKLRRDGAVTRDEYGALRDRLETLRIKAQGQKVSVAPVPEDKPGSTIVSVPVGTEFDIKLQTSLNSGTSKIEQRFEGTTILDYAQGRDIVVPAGSVVRGFVSSVRSAGKIDRKGSLTLSFDEMRIGNRGLRLRASVTQALDPKIKDDATRIGAGAVVGAIIGGIIGGGKGAMLGVVIGGGGTIAATEGSDVDLPAGTILRIRLDQPLEVPIERGAVER